MLTLFFVVAGLLLLWAAVAAFKDQNHVAGLSPSEQSTYFAKKSMEAEATLYGPLNHEMICPHCHTKGQVRARQEVRKAGVSGGKATGALLTGGVSLLATGLSRKVKGMKAFCSNCKIGWSF